MTTYSKALASSATASKEWLTSAEAARVLGYSPAHLARLRMTGEGPDYYKPTKNQQGHVRYRRSDLERWMSARMIASTRQSA